MHRRHPDPAVRRRAHIVLLLADGRSWSFIESALYGSRRTIDRWKKRFEPGGIEPLAGKRRGRAWRNGTVGLAIGTAGLAPVNNQVGEQDLFGNALEVTEPAVADELAAGSSLVMGQAAQAVPVVLARGACLNKAEGGSGGLIRDKSMDMFR